MNNKDVRARRGLSLSEVERSREKYGQNRMTKRRGRSFLSRFLSNLGDPVIRILLLALGINVIFLFQSGDILETLGIAVSVFLATLISTLSEQGSERAYSRLSAESESTECRVRRDGRIISVPIYDIVVGDRVLVSAGEGIAADGFLVSGEVTLDMSAMTGESRDVMLRAYPSKKLPPRATPGAPSALCRGCLCISGEGEMTVTAVGDATFLGGIAGELSEEVRESPLKLRLGALARQISYLGYGAAVIVAIASLASVFLFETGFRPDEILARVRDVPFLLSSLLDAFTLALTVIVVAVPEGLPMMIAVVLSSNIRRMIRDGVLVRRPVGLEAAGCMNILFTDKTGTLTEGKPSVSHLFSGSGREISLGRGGPISELYVANAIYNTTAVMVGSGGRPRASGGNAAERALLDSVSGIRAEECEVISKKLFDSSLKYSSARVRRGGRELLLIKGAPELLLPRVKYYISDDTGEALPLEGRALSALISERSREGGRMLIIACGEGREMLPSELTLICAAELCDRPRRNARASVERLTSAGVGVVMMTGDSRETASAIAESCGIFTGRRRLVLDSRELAAMTDGELSGSLDSLAVVCRALPSDKSRLVRLAEERGLVTGMTGDGINDAPALRRADIGFAMGSGTEVAREAGDIVILNDDLSSIGNAVLYGRSIFKSIRKFITLQLTVNLCALGVSMLGPFIGVPAPVTVVQMLWVNIIMDTLGGLAFAGEPAHASSMKEKPKRQGEQILNRYMIGRILTLGLSALALSIVFLKSPAVISHFRDSEASIYHLSAFFAFFIFTGVACCFAARTDRISLLSGISKNPAFVGIMLSVLAIQLCFIYLGGSVLRCAPLLPSELLYAAGMSLLIFPIDMLSKLICRLFGQKGGY